MNGVDRLRTAACAAFMMILAVGAAGCAQNQHNSSSSNLGGVGAPAVSTSPGGDSDPSSQTVTVTGGVPSAGGWSTQSNHVPITITCES